MTAKSHEQLGAKHKPGSEEFDRAFDAEMETQRQRVMGRLLLEIPLQPVTANSPAAVTAMKRRRLLAVIVRAPREGMVQAMPPALRTESLVR